MASLQRAFNVLVLGLAMSSILVAAARTTPDGLVAQPRGSVNILNYLSATLTVECDSNVGHLSLGLIPKNQMRGFEFNIADQTHWTCRITGPETEDLWAVFGTFDLWARAPSFSAGSFVHWLVDKDGLYLVPNLNPGVTLWDGKLIYRWNI